MEAARVGSSVAQEPSGGAADGGAGLQRGHAARAGALRPTHSRQPHSSSVLVWQPDVLPINRT